MFKILVVEDNANVRRLVQVVLKQNGFEPILAENAMKALSILDEEYVDLIILDIMMPGMDERNQREQNEYANTHGQCKGRSG